MNRLLSLFVVSLFVVFSMGCATTRFVAIQGNGVSVDEELRSGTQTIGDLTLQVRQTNSPRGLIRSITAFEVTVFNRTEHVVDFIPSEFVLFNEYGNQFFPMHPDALYEAASASSSRTTVMMGYGHGSHISAGYVGYRYAFGPSYSYPRKRYQGLLAKAFPMHPVPVYPNANLTGVLYFPVGAHEFDQPRLQIVRFTEPPLPDGPRPQQALYSFSFRPKP